MRSMKVTIEDTACQMILKYMDLMEDAWKHEDGNLYIAILDTIEHFRKQFNKYRYQKEINLKLTPSKAMVLYNILDYVDDVRPEETTVLYESVVIYEVKEKVLVYLQRIPVFNYKAAILNQPKAEWCGTPTD